jgi:hypothetical protein
VLVVEDEVDEVVDVGPSVPPVGTCSVSSEHAATAPSASPTAITAAPTRVNLPRLAITNLRCNRVVRSIRRDAAEGLP